MALAAARTITRFGRTFVEYDPDGAGGGPATWILGGGGAGTGSGASGSTSGIYQPLVPGLTVRAGMALYFTSDTNVDLALAKDAPVSATTGHPWRVVGLASGDAAAGQSVGLISDGQLSLADWTPVAGTPQLSVGRRYYLSDLVAGTLTVQCPTATGSTVVSVGQALSPTTLEVETNLMVRL